MKNVIVITGASSGFGALAARALAIAGHTVYASMPTEEGPGPLDRKHEHPRWHTALLSPYFAAKAAMDALAVSYAAELNRWGIETSIIVPGAFTSGTNHFAHAGSPADKARQADYDNGPYAHLGDDIMKGFAAIAPADADVNDVAKAIVRVVDMPFGKRPFRVHIDPAQDGAEIVNGVADRVRTEMYRNLGLSDLLTPVIS
jgi:NAD(P)-dependent dehydrogenase (short-subunit alcohol dehydrogenase family)